MRIHVLVAALLISALSGYSSVTCGWNLVDGETAQAAHASIRVDGKIEPAWQKAEAVQVRKLDKESTSIDHADAPTATVRFLWDDKHLYVLADVLDVSISTKSSDAWAQDSIEFLIDENYSRSKIYQSDDAQYRVSAIGEISCGYGINENIAAKVVPITGGYRVEAAIKFQEIKPKPGQRIGFEIQLNNDPGSGQRQSVTKWNHPHNDSWRDTSNFGTLVLVEKQTGKTDENQRQDPQPDRTNSNGDPELSVPALKTSASGSQVPGWAADAVFYQIFPERFCNGDASNDPTRESLEFPDIVPETWKVTPWTQQWYARSEWEKSMGADFFNDGVFHRRYGGDLQGVISKLDYLSDLGINAIYFNPVFHARSLHKYDGNSFHHIDPYFGPDPENDLKIMATETADPATWKWTRADKLFLELLQQAHRRGIRVLIDGVFNHTGRDFFAFADIAKNQQDSPYLDWYIVESFDDPDTEANEFKYQGWWGVDTLPEFANDESGRDLHPAPREYVFQATRRWMDPDGNGDPSDGIDGWRLDVANEVPNQFWRDWNRYVRRLNPEAYTVAEIWDNAGSYLEDCGFSATMNYHGFAFPVKGFLIDGRLPANQFAKMLVERMKEHQPDVMYGLQNLIDSHDTDRVASMIVNAGRQTPYKEAGRFDYDIGERSTPRYSGDYRVDGPSDDDKQILRLVAMFQMTFVGAPMIYYGTEAGMDGADDPCDRMPMVWDDLQYETRTLGPRTKLEKPYPVKFDRELYSYFRDLIRTRNDHRCLRRGSFEVLHADEQAGLLVYGRRLGDDAVIVALNRGDQSASFDLTDTPMAKDATTVQRLVSSRQPSRTSTGTRTGQQTLKLTVPARTGEVWQVQ